MIGPLLTHLFFFCTSCCCLGNVGPVAVDDTLTFSKSGSLVVKLGQLLEIHSDLSDADWVQSLSLRLAQPADAPAILGKRRFHPATKEIEFIPRFPLVGGSEIRVEIFDRRSSKTDLESSDSRTDEKCRAVQDFGRLSYIKPPP